MREEAWYCILEHDVMPLLPCYYMVTTPQIIASEVRGGRRSATYAVGANFVAFWVNNHMERCIVQVPFHITFSNVTAGRHGLQML